MKLSEIDADRALDVVADILPAIGRMANSKALSSFYKAHKNQDIMGKAVRADVIFSLFPALIKSNKQDILQIVASVTGSTINEVKALSVKELYETLKDMLTDPELLELFGSSANTEQDAPSVSSPVAEGQSDAQESH